jgi:hypothetical protein
MRKYQREETVVILLLTAKWKIHLVIITLQTRDSIIRDQTLTIMLNRLKKRVMENSMVKQEVKSFRRKEERRRRRRSKKL